MHIRLGRLGQFLLFIGIILLVVFFVSDQNTYFQPGFFFVGLVLAFLGVYIIWRDWKPTGQSKRFRTLRRLRKKDEPEKKE
jgi:cadmium resistance protein CadD (predicted permease)